MFGPSLARWQRRSIHSWAAVVAKGVAAAEAVTAGKRSLAGSCQMVRWWESLTGAHVAKVAATFEWRILLLILMKFGLSVYYFD